MATLNEITAELDRLASLDASPFPLISLYLNLQPNQNGRDSFEPFLRKELGERLRTFPASSPERESMEKDATRIRDYVMTLDPAINGLAIFASGGIDLFEAVPLDAPIPEHCLYVSPLPHLYPLARLVDEYPRYLVLLADTNLARIFVCAANRMEHTEEIEGVKTKRHKMGGWSQARYQRHIDNYHLQHAKEVVDAVARIVRTESIGSIVLSGDEIIVPLLKDQLPKELAERVIDIRKLDIRTPDRDILDTTIAALRRKDADTDRERVDTLVGEYRGSGLACVGVEDTRIALERGQVDELVVAAKPEKEHLADGLVVKARQTSAKVRFIEEAALLASIGGVGAFLRYRL